MMKLGLKNGDLSPFALAGDVSLGNQKHPTDRLSQGMLNIRP